MTRYDDDSDETVTFADATAVYATERALRVRIPRPGRAPLETWVPQSVIHEDSEVYDAGANATGRLVLKLWWAEREGLA